MGQSSVQVGWDTAPDADSFYFAGTTSYSQGAAFCFTEDATQELTRGQPTVAEQKAGTYLGAQVEVPATASLFFFAGWAKEGGTGPGRVNLHRPVRGSIIDVQVDGATSVEIGEELTLVDGSHFLAQATDATFNAAFVATALEAENVASASQSAGNVVRVYSM